MTTLSDLRVYWRQQFDTLHAQEDGLLRDWRLAAWLSFQLPLAMNTSVPFYNELGPAWFDVVRNIMRERFDNIMQAAPLKNGIKRVRWRVEGAAERALAQAGVKILLPVYHTEKSVIKIDHYKQQYLAISQFYHSFFDWATDNIVRENPQDKNIWGDQLRDVVEKAKNNIDRSNAAQTKAQQLLKRGGFISIGAHADVSNEDAIEAMDYLLSSLALCEKAGLPQTIAGLDGCHLRFQTSKRIWGGKSGGSATYDLNSIQISVDFKGMTTFWHEWMHMLEDRVRLASLGSCPPQWTKYQPLAPHLRDINKRVRTIPRDEAGSDLYFQDPFLRLKHQVEKLCALKWLNEESREALSAELEGHPPHPTYNLEALKSLLRTKSSAEQRNEDVVALCLQWRNPDAEKICFSNFEWAEFYDQFKNLLLHFHKNLKQKKSNFLSAAHAIDKDASFSYWSQQHELLARSFERFVQKTWMDNCEFSFYLPNGNEVEHVVQSWDVFFTAFKNFWEETHALPTQPLNKGRIAQQRKTQTAVKKRLTRF